MVLSSRSATGVTPLAGLLGITPPEPGIVSFKAAHRAAPRASRSGRTPLYAMAARAVWPCEPNLVENLRRWVVSGLSADQPTGGGFQPGVQSSSVESCPMPVYRLTKDAITELPKATYAERGVKERADLQRLLKANIGVVAPPPLRCSRHLRGVRRVGGLQAAHRSARDRPRRQPRRDRAQA